MKSSRLWLLGLLGCALPKSFVPAERVSGWSPDGYLVAGYQVVVEGRRLGEMALWSNGTRIVDQGRPRTALYWAFQLDNATDHALEIVPGALEVRARNRRIRTHAFAIIYGSTTVPPGGTGVLALRAFMPPGVSPKQLDTFVIGWSVEGEGQVYAERTRFDEYDGPDYAYPYLRARDSYYSPFDQSLHFLSAR